VRDPTSTNNPDHVPARVAEPLDENRRRCGTRSRAPRRRAEFHLVHWPRRSVVAGADGPS
jgi:hypothetical protein